VERQRSPVFPISDGDNLDSQVPSPTTEAWQPGRFEAPASPIYEPGDPDNEVLSFMLLTPPRKQMDVIVGSYKDRPNTPTTPPTAALTAAHGSSTAAPFAAAITATGSASTAPLTAAVAATALPTGRIPANHLLELLRTPAGATKKSVQINYLTKQIEVARGTVVELNVPLGASFSGPSEIDLQIRHADPDYSAHPIVNCGDALHKNQADTELVFDVVTEDNTTVAGSFIDTQKFESAIINGNSASLKLRFNCLSSCKKNTGNNERARKWILRCQWRDGMIYQQLDIPIQVLTKLKDTSRLKKPMRKRNSNDSVTATPVVKRERLDDEDEGDARHQTNQAHFALYQAEFNRYPPAVQEHKIKSLQRKALANGRSS
jgi:hypothetical protein